MRWLRRNGSYGLPGSNTEWVAIATFASGFEADVAVAVLGAAGIPARAAGNDLTGIFGPGFQGASARGVDVLVPADAAEEGRAILADPPGAGEDDPAEDAEDGADRSS
jgi:hypothetical protein